jgi:hypothetical protein
LGGQEKKKKKKGEPFIYYLLFELSFLDGHPATNANTRNILFSGEKKQKRKRGGKKKKKKRGVIKK